MKLESRKKHPKQFSSYEYHPVKKDIFRKSKKHQKCNQKHFLLKNGMCSNIRDLLNYNIVNHFFFIFNILPLRTFWEWYCTLKWVALVGFWIKIIFYFFKIHFAPRGTTHNLTFLYTQNRPTLLTKDVSILWTGEVDVSNTQKNMSTFWTGDVYCTLYSMLVTLKRIWVPFEQVMCMLVTLKRIWVPCEQVMCMLVTLKRIWVPFEQVMLILVTFSWNLILIKSMNFQLAESAGQVTLLEAAR